MITQQCAPPDYDATTHSCSSPYFAESESVLTALTIEQANELLAPILLLWAIAWIYRRLIRVLNQA